MKKRRIIRPTAREERAINAGIASDPDTYELTPAEFAELRPFRRGRPKAEAPKVPVTVRLDPDIVAFFRESGRGWQTRLNDALSAYVGRQRKKA